jgi:hypothetical protein
LILVFLCPLLSHLDVQEHFEVVGFWFFFQFYTFGALTLCSSLLEVRSWTDSLPSPPYVFRFCSSSAGSTVKPVYNSHPWDPQKVAAV